MITRQKYKLEEFILNLYLELLEYIDKSNNSENWHVFQYAQK